MKRRGRHPNRELTAVRVKALAVPGRYADGNGLYLLIDTTGTKRWLLRTVVQGRRRDIGLGSVQLTSLADAREKAHQLRGLARDGGDPIAERRMERRPVPTFEAAAKAVHAANASSWRNAKHSAQWLSTLTRYAFPVIGERRIDQVTTAELLKVLSSIWLTKPETARRVRQRIEMVLDWAKAAGYRTGENPGAGLERGFHAKMKKGAIT